MGAQGSAKESRGRVPGGAIAEVGNWCALRGVGWDQVSLRGLGHLGLVNICVWDKREGQRPTAWGLWTWFLKL